MFVQLEGYLASFTPLFSDYNCDNCDQDPPTPGPSEGTAGRQDLVPSSFALFPWLGLLILCLDLNHMDMDNASPS